MINSRNLRPKPVQAIATEKGGCVGGGSEAKKKFVYLKSASTFRPL